METDVFSIISLYTQGEVINRFRPKNHSLFCYLFIIIILCYFIIPSNAKRTD